MIFSNFTKLDNQFVNQSLSEDQVRLTANTQKNILFIHPTRALPYSIHLWWDIVGGDVELNVVAAPRVLTRVDDRAERRKHDRIVVG